MLQPIGDANVETAVALLAKGYPERSAEFWRSGLRRAMSMLPADAGWPIGFLLAGENGPRGVILTFASRRGSNVVVNLSSWYVDPNARGIGTFMLRQVVRRRGAAGFTDLTPSPVAAGLLTVLDFSAWTDVVLFMAVPQLLLLARRGARVVGLGDLPVDSLGPDDRKMLEDHDKAGCIAAAYHNGARWRPLVFARRRVAGVPCGYLLYAEDRSEVLTSRGAVGRFLAKRGLVLFAMNALRAEKPRGAFVRGRLRYLKGGGVPAKGIDYAYSEYVFFDFS